MASRRTLVGTSGETYRPTLIGKILVKIEDVDGLIAQGAIILS